MNIKIKFREGFRPFAPSVLRERVAEYFELDSDSPYMLLVAPVAEGAPDPDDRGAAGALGHRAAQRAPLRYPGGHPHRLLGPGPDGRAGRSTRTTTTCIREFEGLTGCAVLVNTSFNVRGEPIVCTPRDAYRCFMRTHIDTWSWGRSAAQGRTARVEGDGGLAQGIPARLTPPEGRKFGLHGRWRLPGAGRRSPVARDMSGLRGSSRSWAACSCLAASWSRPARARCTGPGWAWPI